MAKRDLRAELQAQLDSLRDLEAAAREAQSRVSDAMDDDAGDEGDGDPDDARQAAAQAELQRLEEILQRMLGRKSDAGREAKAAPMKCPHCGEEMDPMEHEPDADPDDKSAKAAAQDRMAAAQDRMAAVNRSRDQLLNTADHVDRHLGMVDAGMPLPPNAQGMTRDELRQHLHENTQRIAREHLERVAATGDDAERAAATQALDDHARRQSSGDVAVHAYERDGKPVHGYSRRRPKKGGGAHLVYA